MSGDEVREAGISRFESRNKPNFLCLQKLKKPSGFSGTMRLTE